MHHRRLSWSRVRGQPQARNDRCTDARTPVKWSATRAYWHAVQIPSLKVGVRVDLLSKSGAIRARDVGEVAYMGETEFADGEWVGVVLDDPEGKNDGSVQGVRYFTCAANHGLFVRAKQCRAAEDSLQDTVLPRRQQTPDANVGNGHSNNGEDSDSCGDSAAAKGALHSRQQTSPNSRPAEDHLGARQDSGRTDVSTPNAQAGQSGQPGIPSPQRQLYIQQMGVSPETQLLTEQSKSTPVANGTQSSDPLEDFSWCDEDAITNDIPPGPLTNKHTAGAPRSTTRSRRQQRVIAASPHSHWRHRMSNPFPQSPSPPHQGAPRRGHQTPPQDDSDAIEKNAGSQVTANAAATKEGRTDKSDQYIDRHELHKQLQISLAAVAREIDQDQQRPVQPRKTAQRPRADPGPLRSAACDRDQWDTMSAVSTSSVETEGGISLSKPRRSRHDSREHPKSASALDQAQVATSTGERALRTVSKPIGSARRSHVSSSLSLETGTRGRGNVQTPTVASTRSTERTHWPGQTGQNGQNRMLVRKEGQTTTDPFHHDRQDETGSISAVSVSSAPAWTTRECVGALTSDDMSSVRFFGTSVSVHERPQGQFHRPQTVDHPASGRARFRSSSATKPWRGRAGRNTGSTPATAITRRSSVGGSVGGSSASEGGIDALARQLRYSEHTSSGHESTGDVSRSHEPHARVNRRSPHPHRQRPQERPDTLKEPTPSFAQQLSTRQYSRPGGEGTNWPIEHGGGTSSARSKSPTIHMQELLDFFHSGHTTAARTTTNLQQATGALTRSDLSRRSTQSPKRPLRDQSPAERSRQSTVTSERFAAAIQTARRHMKPPSIPPPTAVEALQNSDNGCSSATTNIPTPIAVRNFPRSTSTASNTSSAASSPTMLRAYFARGLGVK